ncbi:MAG: hypothetical protein ACK4YP_10390 [Myxococcota bacterium]
MRSLLLLVLAGCSGPADDKAPADSGADSGPDDTAADTATDTGETGETGDTDETADPNEAPGAVEIAITPLAPAVGEDFAVTLVTPAVDPDGDAVTYTYAWTVDGTPSSVTGASVAGASTAAGQRWAVTVTPTDGALDGPAATASVVVGNEAPSAPGLTITPAEPEDGDDLVLTFDPPAVDPDGDPLTTTITWYQNDSYVPWFDGLTTISGAYVEYPDVFRVVVSVTDGFHDPVVAEASVALTYTCDNLPPFNLGDETMPGPRAYHGLAFTDDGYLLGYDARGSLTKTAYGGEAEVFLPGVGTVQQIDRLPDGDYVYADNSTGRLVRLAPGGGTTTISSAVGSVYGVTVGPDGMIYVTYPDLKRVDPDTGELTQLLPQPSGYTYHVADFSLDSTKLYLGTIGGGNVYVVDLDDNLDPVGEPTLYASRVGSGWHDGLGLDICGNLYVADYSSRGLYRVETDGTVTSMAITDPTAYGHGLQWGNGVGGWRTDTLYLPQPYNGNTVREVVIGMPAGDTVRTWRGELVPW